MGYWYLAIAIAAEVVGTMALKASDGFNNATASTICIAGYGAAFYFLSLVLKTVPLPLPMPVWAGMGIVLIAAVSAILYKQLPDLAACSAWG